MNSVNEAEPGDQEVLNMHCADGTQLCVAPGSDNPRLASVLIARRDPSVATRLTSVVHHAVLTPDEVDVVIDALQKLRLKIRTPSELVRVGQGDAKATVTACLRRYLTANDALRKSKCGYQSCGPCDTPEWQEYMALDAEYNVAYAALWAATDFEYDDDEFRTAVWNWRFWKVMARKCCWYQKHATVDKAGETMASLGRAEWDMVKACGLLGIYRSTCSYIEEAFPGLKTP